MAKVFLQILSLLFVLVPTWATAQELRELGRYLDKSVGKVLVFNARGDGLGSGTGFAVGTDEDSGDILFLTNEHVVRGSATQRVSYGEENVVKSFQVEILLADREYDMALLRLKPRSDHGFVPQVLRLSDFVSEQGDDVYAIGFPGFSDRILESGNDPALFEPVLTQGIIGKRFENSWVNQGRRVEWLQHSAEINPGNSGGPLVDRCGNVVGLNTAIPNDASIAGASLSSSAKAIGEFLAGTVVEPIPSNGRCRGRIGGGGFSTDQWIALAATVLLLGAIAGTVVYYYKPQLTRGPAVVVDKAAKPVASEASKPFLTATIGAQSFVLTTQMMQNGLTIGRGEDADLRVHDERLSRSHAKIILRNRILQIQDVGSTNGTSVDGVRLEPRKAVQINTKSQIDLGGLPFSLAKAR